MLYGISDAVFGPLKGKDYGLYVSKYFRLVLAKFVCSVSLHFMLYPHMARSMAIMKFMINHPHKFTNVIIPFFCTAVFHFINLSSQSINIYLLCYQPTVETCIIHFVALKILPDMPLQLLGSLMEDRMKTRIFKHKLQ
jgi:hypothetical protein